MLLGKEFIQGILDLFTRTERVHFFESSILFNVEELRCCIGSKETKLLEKILPIVAVFAEEVCLRKSAWFPLVFDSMVSSGRSKQITIYFDEIEEVEKDAADAIQKLNKGNVPIHMVLFDASVLMVLKECRLDFVEMKVQPWSTLLKCLNSCECRIQRMDLSYYTFDSEKQFTFKNPNLSSVTELVLPDLCGGPDILDFARIRKIFPNVEKLDGDVIFPSNNAETIASFLNTLTTNISEASQKEIRLIAKYFYHLTLEDLAMIQSLITDFQELDSSTFQWTNSENNLKTQLFYRKLTFFEIVKLEQRNSFGFKWFHDLFQKIMSARPNNDVKNCGKIHKNTSERIRKRGSSKSTPDYVGLKDAHRIRHTARDRNHDHDEVECEVKPHWMKSNEKFAEPFSSKKKHKKSKTERQHQQSLKSRRKNKDKHGQRREKLKDSLRRSKQRRKQPKPESSTQPSDAVKDSKEGKDASPNMVVKTSPTTTTNQTTTPTSTTPVTDKKSDKKEQQSSSTAGDDAPVKKDKNAPEPEKPIITSKELFGPPIFSAQPSVTGSDTKTNGKSPKNKKKKGDDNEMTDNTPTVFESIDAPIRPLHDALPVRKIDTTKVLPKIGTGKAEFVIDDTPTAYEKKKKKDASDDEERSTYIPYLAAYRYVPKNNFR
uniref:Uncharacterized protein n=1 Tax=Panagrolaimus sp. JU765 TaxID=591449 RepID=A0AC34QRB7_9BILA